MIAEVLVYPTSTLLTTRAAVKAEGNLGTLTDAQNAIVDDLIASASSAIVGHCGREFARAKIVERVPGFDGLFLQLFDRLPLAVVDEVLYRDDQAFTDYVIDDRVAGFLYRELGWLQTSNIGFRLDSFVPPNQDRPDWWVTYSGGYMMPADNLSAKTDIAATSSAGVYGFTSAAAEFPVTLRSGDRVTMSGFASPATANNKTFTVTGTPTTAGFNVVEAVTAKVAGDTVSVVFQNLPKAVQDAATLTVIDMYRNSQRNTQVASKTVSKLTISYGSAQGTASDSDMLTPRAVGFLKPFRRVF